MNNHLNGLYNSNEIYVKEVWEDDNGSIQIELNPNGIIKTRNQKIDEILNGGCSVIEHEITISKNVE